MELLLEAAKYVEAKARGEEPHDYDSFSRLCTAVKSTGDSKEVVSQAEDGRLDKRRAGGAGTREVHNKLEKNRRAHLRECFDLLKKQVPSMDDRKTSNLSILRGALRHIHGLKRKEREYEHEMERLAREKIASQQRLAALKKELSTTSPHVDIAHFLTDNETTTTASECGASDGEEQLSESSAPSCRLSEVVARQAPLVTTNVPTVREPTVPETPSVITRSVPADREQLHSEPTPPVLSIPNGTPEQTLVRPVVFPASSGAVPTQIRLAANPMVSASSLQIGSVFTTSHTVQMIGQTNSVKMIATPTTAVLPTGATPVHIISSSAPSLGAKTPQSLVRVTTSGKTALVSPVALVTAATPATQTHLVLNPLAAKQAQCIAAQTNGMVYTHAKTISHVLPSPPSVVSQATTMGRQVLATLKPVVSSNNLARLPALTQLVTPSAAGGHIAVAVTPTHHVLAPSTQQIGKMAQLLQQAKPVVVVGIGQHSTTSQIPQ